MTRRRPYRSGSYHDALMEFERKFWRRMLKLTHGNRSRAAELANVNRTDFYKHVKRCGLKMPKPQGNYGNKGNWQGLTDVCAAPGPTKEPGIPTTRPPCQRRTPKDR